MLQMSGKIVAGLVTGGIAAYLGGLIFGLITGTDTTTAKHNWWVMYIVFASTVILAAMARSAKSAWGRGLALNGMLCLALPLAGFAFSVVSIFGIIDEEPFSIGTAGSVIGIGLAGGFVMLILGFLGFFAALIFLIPAYFLLRGDGSQERPGVSGEHDQAP